MGEDREGFSSPGNFPGFLWQPAGVIYLCFCLTGLATGLFYERIVPQINPSVKTTLPTLQTLAAAQMFFFLLAYPIILLKRRQATANSQRPTAMPSFSSLLLELLGMFFVTIPLYIIAAWLSDAAAEDILRAILAVASVCPLGVLAGRLLAWPIWRGGVMLLLLVIVLGLPGAWYICADFLRLSGDWAFCLSPVFLAWTSAGVRQASWCPHPLWAWLTWPILAAAGGLCLWILPRHRASVRSGGEMHS